MLNIINPERLIRAWSETISKAILCLAEEALSEEEVRIGCTIELKKFLKAAKIKVKDRHEYGLAGGHIDSKYGAVIIEYKNPNTRDKISENLNSYGTRAVIRQIKGRFRDFETEEKITADRIFGIGCDGKRIIFVRKRSGHFEIDHPQKIDAQSISRILRALVSLGAKGHSYTPEHLAVDFGANSLLAKDVVAKFFKSLTSTKSKKAKTLFSEWQLLFGEVCGYDIQTNSKLKVLGKHYQISTNKYSELLFSIHTYYAIFIKLLAAEIAGSLSAISTSVIKRAVASTNSRQLKRNLSQIEEGGIWAHLGITNFLEGDLFSWYIDAWDDDIAEAIFLIVHKLDDYDPTTLSVDPDESRDLLKKLYQELFPRTLRHDLGEYYTPDWLGEYLLDSVGYNGDPDLRILDPGCGSGTLLVLAINRIKQWFSKNRYECGFDETELINKILRNIVGFDLNPLATMTARTNYLFAIRDLIGDFSGSVEIPIYLCDSVKPPSKKEIEFRGKKGAGVDLFSGYRGTQLITSVGEFIIPNEIGGDWASLVKYVMVAEHAVRDDYSIDEFLARCDEENLATNDFDLHKNFYGKLQELYISQQNGIWARIIKNAFAPIFVGSQFDYVIGNPPWINWENLPSNYRESTIDLWNKYELREEKGQLDRMRAGKRDLSMLFVYVGIDKYLKDEGKLGFIITQSVFKTKGAGDGFRRFKFHDGENNIVYIKPELVADLSSLKPFESATNRTAVFIASKSNRKFKYPVKYVKWNKKGSRRAKNLDTLKDIKLHIDFQKLAAVPIEHSQLTSPWLTLPRKVISPVRKAIGKSNYCAHEGINTGGLSGCYWVDIKKKFRNNQLLIENLWDAGKKKVKQEQARVESELIYPLVRGKDIDRWHANPSCYVIVPQDLNNQREGIPESQMKRKFPLSYSYLKLFEKELSVRADRKYYPIGSPFYTMRNMASYSLSLWKVIWPEVSNEIKAAVIGTKTQDGQKPILPDHTVVAVSCESEEEAHFICALLNSLPSRIAISGYIVLHPSPHILQHISIPSFNSRKRLHKKLAVLSKDSHNAAKAKGRTKELEKLQEKIDSAAGALWNISKKELEIIQKYK